MTRKKNCFNCEYLRYDSNKDGFCGNEDCDRYQCCVVNDKGIVFRGQCRNFTEKGKAINFDDYFVDKADCTDDD